MPPSAEFSTYLNFCRSLRFDDKPDYSYLRQLFRNLFHRQGFSYDYVFDWNMLKFVSHPKDLSGRGHRAGLALGPRARVLGWRAGLPADGVYELARASSLSGASESAETTCSCFIHVDGSSHHGRQPPGGPRKRWLSVGSLLAILGIPAGALVACVLLLLLLCAAQAAPFPRVSGPSSHLPTWMLTALLFLGSSVALF